MQADILGAPVWRTAAEEGPAHGAALLGGVVAGAFKGVTEAVEASVQMLDPLDPRTERSARYDHYFAIYRDLYGSLRQAGRRLTELAEAL
jgi:xylulokinase